MSAPAIEPSGTLSMSGYEDGLGRRSLVFDRASGATLERLVVRPELFAFERSLKDRAARLAGFEDERVARIRSVRRDAPGKLVVDSEFIAGDRLCDMLDVAADGRDEASAPGVDVALGFLLELLPALSALHAAAGIAHGAVGPGRITLTPTAQVVLLDPIFGEALQRLQFTRARLWREFGIAAPAAAGPVRFDTAADVTQAAVSAVMLVLGRPLHAGEYPSGLPAVLSDVGEIAQIRGSGGFASGVQQFLQRALALSGRPFTTAQEAAEAVHGIAESEMGAVACRTALSAFVEEIGRPRETPIPAPAQRAQPAPASVKTAATPPAAAAKAPPAPAAPPVKAAAPQPAAPAPVKAAPVRHEPVAPVPEPPAPVSVAPPPIAPPPIAPPPIAPAPVAAAPIAPAPAPAPAVEIAPAAPPAPEPVVVAAAPAVAPAPPAPAPQPVAASQPVAAPAPAVAVPAAAASIPAAVPAAAPPAPAPPAPEPVPVKESPRRKRERSARGKRDRLRSIASPTSAAAPPPPLPAPPIPQPVFNSAPGPYGPGSPAALQGGSPYQQPSSTRVWEAPAAAQPPIAVVAPPPPPPQPAVLRVKAEPPAGYKPPSTGRIFSDEARHSPRQTQTSAFPWKLVAAAGIVLAAGIFGGKSYMAKRPAATAPAATAPAAAAAVGVPTPPSGAVTGTVLLTTDPAGARVLMDGQPAGVTPLTLLAVKPGRRTFTFESEAGTVKRVLRVEAGKSVTLDVPIFSGWIAISSPIVLDVSENGRAVGTTEQGRLMLAPGRHVLTVSNAALEYSSVHTVEIDPGEDRRLTIEPRASVSMNAVPWAEVWIDGKRAGETPIANLQMPLGTREIVFKHPEFGERRVTTTVKASSRATISVDFTKPALY